MVRKPARNSRKAVGPDADHQRQPDGRVDRVAAADPVPEPERVGGVDAEVGDGVEVGGQGDEVGGDVGVVAEPVEQPRLGVLGVGERLDAW